MQLLRTTLIVSLLAATVALSAHSVQASAQTPTPTATAQPGSPTAPAPPAPTVPPNQVSVFEGPCWLDARPCVGTLSARVDGTICASTDFSYVPPDGTWPLFVLQVPSNEVTAGCGREGAAVQFFVGDEQVSQPGIWRAGAREIRGFVAGHTFANIGGSLRVDRQLSNESLVPYVTGNACGYGEFGPPPYGYYVVVYSAEQQAGCGVEGSPVTFKLLDAQGNVVAVANEKGVWHAWDGVSDVQHLNLTFGPATAITMPPTGTGGASAGIWPALSAVLGLLGITGVGTRQVLRKRSLIR